MKRLRVFFILAATQLAVLSGCMRVDYVGRQYSPTAEVAYLGFGETIPGGYEIMGLATLTSSEGYSNEEIRSELLEKAKKVGAEAVLIHSVTREESGSYETADSANNMRPSGSWERNSWNIDGSRNYTDSWGRTTSDRSRADAEIKEYNVIVKAYFLRRPPPRSDSAGTDSPVADSPAESSDTDTVAAEND